ncbi:condensation domain-containing protein [Streptomyces sp. NRRL F-5053]|uniref:condensation domain-containing protein n=1 Tax=Streptomyces sp. NRRL F-5053 TaxID=1463854 RepID=UPI0004C93DD6|nr:condensation domain-containing protein [Streptomyces sp. NRRL F-5053]
MTTVLYERLADAGQYALWAEAEIDPSISGGGYFVGTFHGAVARSALESAALAVLHRHEPLRSVLRLVEGQLRQCVLPAQEALSFDDSELPCARGDERATVRAWTEQHVRHRRWDLSTEAPLRFHLLRHDTARCSVVFAVHHAGFDGRSKFLVARDFAAHLAAVRAGRAARPTPLTAPATPVAPPEVAEEARAFWRRTVETAEPMALPEGGRPGRRRITSSPTVELDPAAVTALRDTARTLRVSTFTMLLAALIRQLAAYGNSSPLLALASDVSDETTRDVAGLQINVVPVAVEAARTASTEDSVAAARAALSQLARYRRVPFVDLVAGVPGRPLARLGTELGLSFPRPPAGLDLDVPGLRTAWDFFTPNTSATLARTLQIRADWPECRVRLDHRENLMGAEEAEQFLTDFRTAVADLAADRTTSSLATAVADRPATGTGGAPYSCAGTRVGTVLDDDPPHPPRLLPADGHAFTAHGPSGQPLPRSIAGAVHVRFPDGRTLPTGDSGYIAADGGVRLLGPAHGRWICTRNLIDTSAVRRVALTHPWVTGAEVRLEKGRSESAVLTVTGSGPRPPGVRELRAHLRTWLHGSELPGRIRVEPAD